MAHDMRKLLNLPRLPAQDEQELGIDRLKQAAWDYMRGVSGDLGGCEQAEDPVWLMRQVGMEPTDWQVEYLNSTAPQEITLACRGAGKSRVVAARTLSRMLTRPGYEAIFYSPTQRQSTQLLSYVKEMFFGLGAPLRVRSDQQTMFQLWNNSWVRSFPDNQKGVRGYHPNEVVLDEAAQISDSLYYSVHQMVMSKKGSVTLLSTPFGKRGFFWDVWDKGINWRRTKITGEQCGRYTPKQLQHEREQLGTRWFEQEINVQFLDAIDAVFREADIRAALDPSIKPLFG